MKKDKQGKWQVSFINGAGQILQRHLSGRKEGEKEGKQMTHTKIKDQVKILYPAKIPFMNKREMKSH
jgi:hypothetical protein